MTTTMANCRIELSKQIGDYYAGTTTSAGTTTTIVDELLKQFSEDWITDWTWDLITSATCLNQEKRISSMDNANGTCTLALAHSGTGPGISATFEIHRLFKPSDLKLALIYAARAGYPWIHEKVWDESMVSGNWLKDGSFEIWTSETELTHWTASGSTLAQTSTAYLFEHGAYSCKLSSGAGYIQQSVTNWDDIKRLAGRAVTFTCRGWCDTASCLRISINDGVNDEEYSSYHDGDDAWTEDSDPLTVTHTIDDNPTEITFKIYHALEAASEISYVDDARVICAGTQPRLFIDQLGLAQEMPHQVFMETSDYSLDEPWALIHNAVFDTENGYLYLPYDIPNDYRLRIRGLGYLDFLASGVSSATWPATINIEAPQTDILVAQAALWLYTRMAMPNFTSGDRKDYQQMMGFWKQELRERIGKHGMDIPSVPTKWR